VKAILGVSNHSAAHIEQHLRTLKKDKGLSYEIAAFGDTPSFKSDVLVVLSYPHFSKFLPKLNKIANKQVVIVLDAAVHLEYVHTIQGEGTEPINIIDVAPKKRSFCYSSVPLTAANLHEAIIKGHERKKSTKVCTKRMDVIPTILNSRTPSLLNPIQTFLYKQKDLSKRLLLQKVIFEWILSMGNTADLAEKLKEHVRESPAVKELCKAFKDDLLSKTRKCVRLAISTKADFIKDKDGNAVLDKGGKPKKAVVNYKKLAKKHGIDAYDIRYMAMIIRKYDYQLIDKPVAQILKEDSGLHHTARQKEKMDKKAKGKKKPAATDDDAPF